MKYLWLRLLGVDATCIPDDAQIEFMLADPPRSWRVFLALAVVGVFLYGVFWLYRREVRTCPRRAKVALAAVRAAVILSLVVVFMGPAVAISRRRVLRPDVVLLLDDSTSMYIQDRYHDQNAAEAVSAFTGLDVATVRRQNPSRATLVNQLLRRGDGALLRQLMQRGNLRVIKFSNKLKTSELYTFKPSQRPPAPRKGFQDEPARTDPVPSLSATGPGTDLAKAIRGALMSATGNRLAGIILTSDGQNTQGDDPLAAADAAAEQNVPILAVGVGDPTKPPNLKVSDLWAPDTVFRDDPFVLQAIVQADNRWGISHEEDVNPELIEVHLLQRRADGPHAPGKIVARQNVAIGPVPQTINFQHTPKSEGTFVYSVHVEPRPGELIESDNEDFAVVKVLGDSARVLLIAGAPSWEYRMVRALLMRDKTIDLSCWLQSKDLDMVQDGNTVIDKLPKTSEQLFQYDVVLLFDPDPSPRTNPLAFDRSFVDLLKKLPEEHGSGLLYMSGPKFATSFLTHSRTGELRDLLPVQFGDLGVLEVEMLTKRHTRPWPFRVAPNGVDHPILQFTTDRLSNQRICDALPGLYWSCPVARAKPTARILLEHSDPAVKSIHGARPLLVTGQYGPGRTAFLGFDSTWRWRRIGRDGEFFDKFWIQTVRYLIEGRRLGGQRRGRIGLDRDVYPVGSRIIISAELFDHAYQPLKLSSVSAALSQGTHHSEVLLKSVPNNPGQYQASLIATRLGLNKLSVTLPGAKVGDSAEITRQFTVEIPRVEFDDPRLNRTLLAAIAERSAGRYFDINQIDQLLAAIPDRQQTIVIRGKTIPIWDTNRLLMLLVVLLSVEWGFRKFFRLL